MTSTDRARHARRVLIADDDISIQQLLTTVVGTLGATPVCVGDGAAALVAATAQGADYAAVLLDKNMPLVDGITVAGQLRQQAPQLSVIVVSAHLTADDMAHLAALGVPAMEKPFMVDELLALLRRYLLGTGGEQSRAV
jgi:two-component system nitrogen regulation response regulator GlnG